MRSVVFALWILLLMVLQLDGFHHIVAPSTTITISKHGYDDSRISTTTVRMAKVDETNPPSTFSGGALCQKSVRIRGCDLIHSQDGTKKLDTKRLPPLPCVTTHSCPYDRFRCSRGHMWTAQPGSPSCFECPQCASMGYSAKSQELLPLRNNRALADRVIQFIYERNGTCFNADIFLNKRVTYQSKLILLCAQRHVWEIKISHLLSQRGWCKECYFFSNVLGEAEYHKTAQYFGGQFVRLVDPEERFVIGSKALWKCHQGHEFIQSLQNIRRRPQGKRKCSWCPTCKKVNKTRFTWDPDNRDSWQPEQDTGSVVV